MIYHVNGTVNSSNTEYFNCLSFSKLNIRVYSVGYDTLTEIASTEVNHDGTFSREIETTESSILLKLFYSNGAVPPIETFVDQSEAFCFHDPVKVDFLIDESTFTSNVFDVIYDRIKNHCFDPSLANILPLTPEQIKKISCLTCVTEKSLFRFQAAYRLYQDFLAIDPGVYPDTETHFEHLYDHPEATIPLFFALLNENYSVSPEGILTASQAQIMLKLEEAVDKNEIDASLSTMDTINDLVACRNGLLFNYKPDNSFYDAKLIHASDNNYSDKNALLNAVLDGGGLSGIISDDPMENSDALQRVIPLITLDQHLMHYPPMLGIAVNSIDVGRNPDYYELALEGADLWEGLIVTYPATYASATDYAQAIDGSISGDKPSARLSRNLSGSSFPDASTLKSILDENREFNINEHSVSSFFSKTDTDPNYLEPESMLKMQRLQRSLKLSGDTNNLNATRLMVQNELTSSYAVTRKGKAGFTALMASAGIVPVEKAEKIYCRAEAMNSTISMLMAQYKRYESSGALMPYSLQNPAYEGDPLPNLPDLESLFGSLDTCTCSECQSVYSPAAYLTDLLHWLGTSVICSNGDTGFDALMTLSGNNRRKDIRYLKLNCKNTNTLVPYIDLVNEILSANLLIDVPGNTGADVIAAYQTLQTTKSADELLTEPEHRFPDAEALLKTNYFQWALPYDANYDASLSYLKKLDKPYADIVNAFTSESSRYNNWLWSQAFTGLSVEQASVITNDHSTDPAFWKKFWGIESSDLLDNAASPATPRVGAVLKSAGISLAELQEILTAYYINGGSAVGIVPAPGDACDVDNYTFSPKFTTNVADRFMRFLRLKRATGLSTAELDLAILNHSPVNGIDQAFLTKLASCMAFARQYNLQLTDVGLFFNVNGYSDLFNSSIRSAYFNAKFRNPLFPADVIDFFTTGVYAIHVNDLTNADKQKLSKVFNVSIPMLEAIISLRLNSNPLMSISSLGVLDRYSTFVKVFGITETDLQPVLDHMGDPFSAPDIVKEMWNLSTVFRLFGSLKLSLKEFIAVVGMTGIYDVGAPDMLSKAEELWNKLETAYKKERTAHPEKEFAATSPYLPSDTSDQTYFEQVIAEHLRLPFGLNFQDTWDIIMSYSPTWLRDYVADPEGQDAPRDWAHRGIYFMPVFQMLNRISMLAELFGMKADGISKAVDAEIRGTLSLPDNYFYWLTASSPAIDLGKLLWVKKAMDQAALLDISQEDYLDMAEDYLTNYAVDYTEANDAKIVSLYHQLGEQSAYKDLSVFEFTQTFLRAQLIASAVDNIASTMDSFHQIFTTVKALGYNVSDGWHWVWNLTSDDFSDVGDYSADIRRVLRNKYTDFKTWSDVIIPVQNELRIKLRDALVALYTGTRGFKDQNAIYAYYLLDTQMAPCNQTSRVVAAVSSAQLLVHRALLGLEAHVCMDEDDKNEWEWRKNYRVWEANRKVFLYPENWIDPSLRNNKTSFFRNTEDLLQQDEINQKNSELAFASYLTSLNDVAHLDIRATYMEIPENASGCCEAPPETLHVFARSWNPPYIHYYRTLKNNVWTAWEKMDLETDSDHLIPVMFNRKLYLFFPMFMEKQHQTIKVNVGGQESGAPYLEVRMCYTKLDFGKWSNKKVLNGTLFAGPIAGKNIPNSEAGLAVRLTGAMAGTGRSGEAPVYRGNLVWDMKGLADFTYVSLKKESFYFWPQVDGSTGDLMIHCRRDFADSLENYHDGYTEMAYEWGFKIGACDEKVEIVPPVITETDPNAKRLVARPYMTLPYYQQMKRGKDHGAENTTNDAGLWTKTSYTHAPGSVRTLKKTNGDYVLTYPAQFKDSMKGKPYFFADKRHSMYVNPAGKFSLHEHPFTCKMLEALNRFGIEGLLNSKEAGELRRQAASHAFFATDYNPVSVPGPYPVMDYDFSSTGAYGIYNWEVFFHTVSLIARQLRQSNKFEEALKWINYIFDPANRDVSLQDLRYWKIKPFLIDVTKGIPYYMRLLSAPNLSAAEKEEKKQWEQQIEVWRDHPFDPHLIASMRPRAYMLWTVMELIDILSDWADFLFRQDTTESINEAVNLYVMASEILGERPKKVDRPAPPEYTYDDIISSLTAFAGASAKFEDYMTGLNLCQCRDGVEVSNAPCSNSPALSTLPDLGFCIPDNPRMTQMWDRVEDRLFKIRNCMNIDGKKRQLALFAPPIDPGLLVRATAMGLDLSDVLSDLAAAPPHYRFSYLLQRANDFTNEVKSLGSQLLTALEKKDGEELSVLRQIHEQNILKASRSLKEMQLEEARQNYSTLQYSKNLIQIRLDDYKNREYKNSREENYLRQTQLAEGFAIAEQGVRLVAGFLNLIPDPYAGVPSGVKLIGGDKVSKLIGAGAGALSILASVNRNKASMSLTYAGYDRRQEEWDLQIKSATEELLQVDRQLLSAEIRIAIAEKELENHDLQAAQSAEVYDWLKSKYTNQALYTWMAGQLKTLHRKAYDQAYDMAKLAQQAFFKDLGAGIDAPKVNFGNWDSSRAGFFAGERLSIQLKELESSYMQHNTRDYELSKNISLALLDPLALEDLKTKGFCDINVPELLFDLDYPGHYFRKIRSVSISIPGIAGPYTTVAATLTLNSHSIRKDPAPGALNPESGYGESIATSSAQNDSGVFELNFRDERYMPFEHKGAIGSWRLELSQIARASSETVRAFDFNTISDVIMHLNYTAKSDGAFAQSVAGDIDASLSSLAAAINAGEGLLYAVNLKHDMPNQWHQLKTTGSTSISIPKNRLPYMMQALSPVAGNVTAIAYTDVNTSSAYELSVNSETVSMPKVPDTSVYRGSSGSTGISLDTDFVISVSGLSGPLPLNDTDELVIIVAIGVS